MGLFLIEKSEAFAVFKNFKAQVENETNSFIRALRMDRGGEFTSQEFNNFCEVNGIHRQLTVAYTPQHNRVAKRNNRTIMNMVRSMIFAKKLPNSFWPEAINWIVHVLNRNPTLTIKNKTPEEAWSGAKPSVEHFRDFGCIAHVHVLDNNRTKLDDKSLSCVLLGVSEESKGYRLYDPTFQRIIISRVVVFEEDMKWDWDKIYEGSIMCELEWGDSEEDTITYDENEKESESDLEADIEGENFSSESLTNMSFPSSTEEMNRRPPVWMRDYTIGEGLFE